MQAGATGGVSTRAMKPSSASLGQTDHSMLVRGANASTLLRGRTWALTKMVRPNRLRQRQPRPNGLLLRWLDRWEGSLRPRPADWCKGV